MLKSIDRSVFRLFVFVIFGLILCFTTTVCQANIGAEEFNGELYNVPEQGIAVDGGGIAAYESNDLIGTWYVHSLASRPGWSGSRNRAPIPGPPWWAYGNLIVNGNGFFSGIIQEYKSEPCEVSGQFFIAPNGVATFWGSPKDTDVTLFPHFHIAANKNVIVGVETWQIESRDNGTIQLTVLTRRGESYQPSDLTGTWYVHSLASGPAAPWWQHGPLIVNADGSFSGILQEYKGEANELSGQFQIDSQGVITINGATQEHHGHMTCDKNMIVMVDTWITEFPGTTELKILTRRGASYNMSDLAGKWYLHLLAVSNGNQRPWGEYGPIDVETDGSFNGDLIPIYNISNDYWSDQFQIDPNGVVTIKPKPHSLYFDEYPILHLIADKNVLVGVATKSSSSAILVLTRIANTD